MVIREFGCAELMSFTVLKSGLFGARCYDLGLSYFRIISMV